VLDDQDIARSRGLDGGGREVVLRRSAFGVDELHRDDPARDLVGAGHEPDPRHHPWQTEAVEGIGDGAGVEPRQAFGYRHELCLSRHAEGVNSTRSLAQFPRKRFLK
jgi:hypothetical protein